MRKYLVPWKSIILLILKASFDKMLEIVRNGHICWNLNTIFDLIFDSFENNFGMFVEIYAPWEFSSDKFVSQHSQWPNIALFGVEARLILRDASYNLWRHIKWGSCQRLDRFCTSWIPGQPKISNLEDMILNQDIGRLDITMHDPMSLQLDEPIQKIPQAIDNFFLCKSLIGFSFHVLVEGPIVGILLKYVDIVLGLLHTDELDDIWRFDIPHYFDLVEDCIFVLVVFFHYFIKDGYHWLFWGSSLQKFTWSCQPFRSIKFCHFCHSAQRQKLRLEHPCLTV